MRKGRKFKNQLRRRKQLPSSPLDQEIAGLDLDWVLQDGSPIDPKIRAVVSEMHNMAETLDPGTAQQVRNATKEFLDKRPPNIEGNPPASTTQRGRR